ncbi:uncharacterized protein [Euphorbia lathyris]|uniref:uncharacterized protein n=1 Tax=Euphorbia lathyris TaxID=212925 RepID=UPI0033135BB1
MVLLKIYLHFRGRWIVDPHLDYINGDFIIKDKFDPDFINLIDLKQIYRDDLKFHNVSELLYLEPGSLLKSRRVFELDGDDSIRRLLYCISKKNNVVHIYASHKVDEHILATDILPLPYKEMDGVGEDEGARGIGEDCNVVSGDAKCIVEEDMGQNVGEEARVENVEVQGDEAEAANVEGDDRVDVEVEVQGEDAEAGKNVEGEGNMDGGLEADVVNRNVEFDVEVQCEEAEGGENVDEGCNVEGEDRVDVGIGENVEEEGNLDGGGHVEDCTVEDSVHVEEEGNGEEYRNVEEEDGLEGDVEIKGHVEVDGTVEEEDGEDDSEDEDYEVSEEDADVGSDDDTDVDGEEEALEQIQEAKKRERYNLEKGRPYFRIGMTFRGIEEAKHAINDYDVTGGYNIRIMKSDKSRIRVRCFECPFHLFISQDRGGPTMVVKTITHGHECNKVFANKRATVKWLAAKFMDRC